MRSSADWTLAGLGEMVLSFLDAMKLDDAVLVGSDTGGAIVQAVAAASPERVRALTLTNCDAFDTFPPFPFNLSFMPSAMNHSDDC